jgi:hypothetical protein
VLTVTDGTHTANIDFVGSYTLANFHFASDGSGGSLVTDPPSSPHQTSAVVIPSDIAPEHVTSPNGQISDVAVNTLGSAHSGTIASEEVQNNSPSSSMNHSQNFKFKDFGDMAKFSVTPVVKVEVAGDQFFFKAFLANSDHGTINDIEFEKLKIDTEHTTFNANDSNRVGYHALSALISDAQSIDETTHKNMTLANLHHNDFILPSH